jgi:sterol desaturase/sphingolipid hydroxylase (fatty acid hydroxylase superfamily)
MVPSDSAAIRIGAFTAVFVLLALWEALAPRRELTASKRTRWTSNLSITVINPVVVRLLIPVLPVSAASLAQMQGWGLLNTIALPYWTAVLTGIVLLDLIIYLQHVLFHAIPALWRLHMMHHADLDFDLTTGLRFHPGELLLSTAIKLSAVTALGVPPLGVLFFAVLLNATSMFNHSNIRLPLALDRILRLIVVTPEMHRVHHSVVIRETNSNFGFNLPWWDRLLGTYKAQPKMGHTGMSIGLAQFRDPAILTLPRTLLLPFTGSPGRQPINRH